MEDLSTCNENGCAAEDQHSVPVASMSTVDSGSLSDNGMVSNNLETSDHEMQEDSSFIIVCQLFIIVCQHGYNNNKRGAKTLK